MRRSSRRVVLATLVAVGTGGCLGLDDEGADADQSATPDEPATPAPATPATPSPAETTPTPREDRTPAGDESGEGPTPTPPGGEEDDEVFPGYETTTVAVRTPDGDLLGWVRAAIADTPELRYLGLSDTDSLPEYYGMLFVYDDVDDRTFVMREMDFGIDIVYADDDGVITAIHHAPEPGPDEDGEDQRYPGRGQYVLEVTYGWTTDRGVEVGDVIDVH